MSSVRTRVSEESAAPLTGVRVVDAGDDFGEYAGRLLGLLGAEVVRLRWSSGAAASGETGQGSAAVFDRFLSAGKRLVEIDMDDEGQVRALRRLIRGSDVVLCRPHSLVSAMARDEGVIAIATSAYGAEYGPTWDPVDDLLVMAAGGLLHLGGYTDTGPVVAFGSQSRIAAGIFAAVAGLAALVARERTGESLSADVSAQESVAQALEDSVATYSILGRVREAQGEEAREAGTGIYRCADGYVSMVAGRLGTKRAWAALVDWLRECEPTASDLAEPRWSEFSYRQSQEACDRFQEIFERFASTRSKYELYVEAQARQIAMSPVNTVADLLVNDQLESRDFFGTYHDDELGREVIVPGPPLRMSATPLRRPTPPIAADLRSLLGSDVAGEGDPT